jgi:hypothetical protein
MLLNHLEPCDKNGLSMPKKGETHVSNANQADLSLGTRQAQPRSRVPIVRFARRRKGKRRNTHKYSAENRPNLLFPVPPLGRPPRPVPIQEKGEAAGTLVTQAVIRARFHGTALSPATGSLILCYTNWPFYFLFFGTPAKEEVRCRVRYTQATIREERG